MSTFHIEADTVNTSSTLLPLGLGEPEDERLPLSSSIADVARRHCVSIRTIYREIERGRLRAVKVGTAARSPTRILLDDERAWLGQLPACRPTELDEPEVA